MSDRIDEGAIKIIELVGISKTSFEDAVQQAVAKACKSVDHVTGVEVKHYSGKVSSGKVSEFHANVKVAFTVK